MTTFLPDLGTAISAKTITLNDQLTITLTAHSLSGQPLLSNGRTTEVTQEVFGHLGTFVLPCSRDDLMTLLRKNGVITFRIVGVGEKQTSGHGEEFQLVMVEMV